MAATTVDTLLVRIEADLSGLRRDLQRVERTTKQSSDKMGRSLKSIDSGFSKIGRTAKALAPILAGALGVGAVRGFIRVGSEVENLRVRLRFLFGDVEEGAKAFDVMARFASKVPFSLQQIQQASGTLASVAKNATELNELLVITGNVAAVSGLGFAEAAGNLQRAFSAGANSADLFRERGVLALAGFEAGAKVSIEETVSTFQKAFGTGGEFDGATNALASTTDGLLSMLGDAFFSFQRAVVDAGLLDAFKELTILLTENMKQTQTFAQVLGRTLAGAVRGVTKVLEFLLDNIRNVTIALTVFLAVNVAAKVAAMASGLYTLSKALVTARLAQVALNKAMLKNPFILAATGALILASEFGALDEIMKTLEESFGDFFEITDDGTGEIQALDEALTGLGKTAGAVAETDFTKSISALKDEAKLAKAELGGMDADFLQALKSAGGLSNIQGNTLSLPQDEKEAAQLGVGLTGPQVLELEALVKARNKATKALEAHQDQMQEAKDIVAGLETEQEALEGSLVSLKAALDAGTISQQEFKEASAAIKEQIEALDPMFQTLVSAVGNMSRQISDSFADMLMSGKLNMDSLKDIFKNFVKTMISKAIELMFINQIMNAAFGLTGASALPTASIPFFAGGGAVRPRAGGGPVLVGERGPELFVPHSAGVIRNNHDTKNMMGGGSPVVVNQNINIETGVAQTVRAEVMSMMPRIKSETVQAMIDGKRRGNSISKAFA